MTRPPAIGAALAFGLVLVAITGCSKPPPVIEGRPDGPYVMALSLEPATPPPAFPTRLTTVIRHRQNRTPVQQLQTLHQRLVHNFIVNLDFSSFAHIHHEDFAPLTARDIASSTLSFPYTFMTPGRYRMVSQFTLADRSWTKHFDILVGDPGEATIDYDKRLQKRFGDYEVRLETATEIVRAGVDTELILELQRGGQPVTDLELLLGNEVHVALWRDDGRNFGHTHSYTPHMAMMLSRMHDRSISAEARAKAMTRMMVEMNSESAELIFPGPRIPIHYVFPEAGTYVLFFHCAPAGRPMVFKFMLDVSAPDDQSLVTTTDSGGE